MTCPGCGAHAVAGRFCAECGTALAPSCPSCGALTTGGRFCSECGSPLQPPTPSDGTAAARPVAPAPVAERRLVTLLFADLVGFTALAETRDPEAVRELLSTYFERSRAVVERYGGTVEKFIGDAVCAVWGVPAAREDDAELAVRAALDLVSTVAALGEELAVGRLELRAGLTTGQVAVTLDAVGEGMVAGDAVNTAARVQSVAAPGQVWVDDTTRSLGAAALAFEPAGQHAVKGKSRPLELFRALRTTAGAGGEQRVDGLEAPFVGRDRELRLVKELFHATAEERRPRLVLVVGEAGIGKSRLAWEFEKYLDAIPSASTWWLRGRCLSYGQGVAGRVVAEMLRSLLRTTDTAPEAVRAALEARLEEVVADRAERDVLRPRLLSLLGVVDDVFEQPDLFACWRGFLEALTRDGSSVTLLVEDLQWADDGSLDFLEHLLGAARSPVMVLALARPEIAERRPGTGTGRRSTTVHLDPLADPAVGRLLDGLVHGLPERLRAGLVQRAEGVPLYAVETVRSLVDRDVVVPSGGRYAVDPAAASAFDLQAMSPPTSLAALMSARLDALPPEQRRVLQDASVLGLSFTAAGLRALSREAADVDSALEGLCRREILVLDSDPRSPERGQHRFVQALLRGVAYDTLSRRDRAARHLAAADHLAGLPEAEELSAVLAAHLLDALAALPDAPQAEALRERARGLLEQAAQHAVETGSPGEALRHLQGLLGLDPDDAVRLRALTVAADLGWRMGRPGTSLELSEQGIALAQRLGQPDHALRFARANARLDLGFADERSCAAAYDDLRAVLAATEDDPAQVAQAVDAARTLIIMGQYDLALRETIVDVVDRLVRLFARHGDDDLLAPVLESLAVWLAGTGERRVQNLLLREAAHRSPPLSRRAVAALSNSAGMQLPDDARVAAASAERSLEVSSHLGLPNTPAHVHLVHARTLLGDADGLRQAALAARDALVTPGFVDYLDMALAWAAWVLQDGALGRDPVAPDADRDPLGAAAAGMAQALRRARSGQLQEAAVDAAERLRGVAGSYATGEDTALLAAMGVDLLLAADRRDLLAATVAPLERVPTGQRYRLLHGTLLRAGAHLADDPVPGLREAAAVLAGAGALHPAAVVRVELARALASAGEPGAAGVELDLAEPVLRPLGARQLAEVDALRAARVVVAPR